MSFERSNEEPQKTYTCKYCGASFSELWQLGNHVKYECEVARKVKEEEKEGEEGPPEARKEGAEEVYKGEPDANEVLRRILESHPDIPSKVRGEVMSWAELRGILDPGYVAYLLQNMRGVNTQTANIVAQKYALALQRAQQEGRINVPFPLFPVTMPQQPTFPMMPSLQSGYPYSTFRGPTPGMPTMPGLYTREDLERARSDWAKEERLRKLEDQLANLYKDLPKIVREAQSEAPGVQYEEIREPIDVEGNICHPDKAVSVRVRRVPITPNAGREDFLDKFIKLKQAGILGKEKEIDENTIRRIMREEAERKPESEEVSALRAQLNDSRKAIEDLKGMMEAKDKQLLVDKINGLESRLSALATTSGEWRTDEMKVLAASIHELGTIIKEKHPVEAARELLTVAPGTMPPPTAQPAGPAERNAVIEGLRPYGLVRGSLKRSKNETDRLHYD